jgi:adenylate cyclase
VLQFIGDEIEAVFGAPLDLPDHPEMAVRASLEMRKRLKNLGSSYEFVG